MKQNFSLLILLFVITNLFADGVQPEGSGIETDPYQIEILDNLLWISTNNNSLDKYFIQIADINASDTQDWNNGEGFSPIGGVEYGIDFIGSFDGQGHIIDSLYINDSVFPGYDNKGLFGKTDGANIENLGLTNVLLIGRYHIGALVGFSVNTSINGCFSTGTVSGVSYIGGLVGELDDFSNIENCYSSANVSHYGTLLIGDSFGGLVGKCWDSNVSNCFSTGEVSGTESIGGLIGSLWHSSVISNSYSNGNVSGDLGNDLVGGLIGKLHSSPIIHNSYYNYDNVLINGEIAVSIGALEDDLFTEWTNNNLVLDIDDYLSSNGNEYFISSFSNLKKLWAFGQYDYHFILTNDIDLSDHSEFFIPYFSGSFDGSGYIIDNLHLNRPYYENLGLFGKIKNSNITNLYITNIYVIGHDNTGGLAGLSYNSSITGCTSIGGVWGQVSVGGLVGQSIFNSSVISSYSNVSVHGNYFIGGIAGWNTESSNIVSCYCLVNANGQSSVGGLVGSNQSSASISFCYSRGSVSCSSYRAGGLVGSNVYNGIINNCFSLADVNGSSSGGLVGSHKYGSTIDKCYSTGNVGNNNGGLVEHIEEANVSNSFWDIESSGQSSSAGGTGKTTAEMKDVATYTSLVTVGLDEPWDFVNNPFDDIGNEDDWDIESDINNGYPFLTVLPTVNIEDESIVKFTNISINNYPNPFNPSTIISFSISNGSKINLSIYNTKGQKVKTLINEMISVGQHSIVWDGDDESGESISSGIYYYKLSVNGKTEAVKKCLLLK